jgi:cyclopropane fatty-acyl-phospholipid synthase-like methyltransferase
VFPFIEAVFPLKPGMQVMEIGCGEGGNLKAALEKGLQCVGVELAENKFAQAKEALSQEIANGKAEVRRNDPTLAI